METTKFYETMVDTKEFRVSMEVAYWLNKKAKEDTEFAEIFKDWYRDVEISMVAYTIYKSGEKHIKEAIDKILNYENINMESPSGDDDIICWLRVTTGEYFGLPDSKEKIEKIRECLVEFAEDFSVGYISEIFERKGYEVV